MDQNLIILIVLGVVVVGAGVYMVSNPEALGSAQSMTGVSMDVRFDDGSSHILASWVADSAEETVAFSQRKNITLANQSVLGLTDSLSIATTPLTNFCNASVFAHQETIQGPLLGLGAKTFTYYTISSWSRHAPVRVKVTRSTLLGDEQIYYDNIDTLTVPSKTFTASNGGTVSLKNLGGLVGSNQCPSGDVVFIREDPEKNTGNWKPVSQAAWEGLKARIYADWKADPFNYYFGKYSYSNLDAPSGWNICPSGSYTCHDGLTFFDSSHATYELPLESVRPMMTADANMKFFDAVIYTQPKGKPSVASMVIPPVLTELNYGSGNLVISNDGGTDTFQIAFSSTGGKYRVDPASDRVNIESGQRYSYPFNLYAATTSGAQSAQDQVCVAITAVGSGASTSKCVSGTIAQVIVTPNALDSLLGATPHPTTIDQPTGAVDNASYTSPLGSNDYGSDAFVCDDGTVVSDKAGCKSFLDRYGLWILVGIILLAAGAYAWSRR